MIILPSNNGVLVLSKFSYDAFTHNKVLTKVKVIIRYGSGNDFDIRN